MLQKKELRFCYEYVKEFNGAKAAIDAGYSAKTAAAAASRLLKKVNIQLKIKGLCTKIEEKADITAEKVVIELSKIALCDIGDALNKDGSVKNIHDIPEPVRKCISSIEIEEVFEYENKCKVQVGVLKKIRFWDKKGALDTLAKRFNLLTEKFEATLNANIKVEHKLYFENLTLEELNEFRKLLAKAQSQPE